MPQTINPGLCSCCPRCPAQPCNRLRYGGVREGAFRLVTGDEVTPGMRDCPFAIHEFDEAAPHLAELSLTELIDCSNEVTPVIDPIDMIGIDQRTIVTSYSDFAARIQFLHALWDAGAVRMVRIPVDYARRKDLRSYLLAFESLMPTRVAAAQEQAAVTDEVEEVAETTISITNPRWEHVDEKRKEKSPDTAATGDRVRLSADVSGIAEGAEVIFDIFDTSQNPAFRIATVKGPNKGGTASAEWDVAGDLVSGENTIAFEASARSRFTEKKEIALAFLLTMILEIDVDDPAAKDDKLILLDESGAEVEKVLVKDMKEISEDMVRIVFAKAEAEKKYSLIRDYGAEDDGDHDPIFVKKTPKELMDLKGAT